jgi:glycosyltransferase involved in cell wall biosynthesis
VSPEIKNAVMERYGLKGPYILYVGTLEPRKNLICLIEAFSRIHAAGMTGYRLVLVGRPGWGLKELYAFLDRSTLKEKIQILGFVPEQDLPTIYRAADVFVYLSLYEGFGFPPLEAMACGTAVVVSNRASIPECVGDGGILVDPLNIDEITEKILLLLMDKSLRRDIGEKGLYQSQKFSWEKSAAQTLALYKQTCQMGSEG